MGKRVAVLQSDYIPWKGYFDLINCVDEFVLYDTAQFTKNDWRNRNRIKTERGAMWLTIPVIHNFGQTIQETQVRDARWASKHWRSIVQYYSKAPCFPAYADTLDSLYSEAAGLKFLSEVNYLFLSAICRVLGIKTRITWSRDYDLVEGQTERLVDLCLKLRGEEYVSGPAAKSYIEESLFERSRVKLTYVDYAGYPEYAQLYPPFEHGVSVIDLILNQGPNARKYMKSL
jgi:hypothetical protein